VSSARATKASAQAKTFFIVGSTSSQRIKERDDSQAPAKCLVRGNGCRGLVGLLGEFVPSLGEQLDPNTRPLARRSGQLGSCEIRASGFGKNAHRCQSFRRTRSHGWPAKLVMVNGHAAFRE